MLQANTNFFMLLFEIPKVLTSCQNFFSHHPVRRQPIQLDRERVATDEAHRWIWLVRWSASIRLVSSNFRRNTRQTFAHLTYASFSLSPDIAQHQGAFVNYRKHLQQQQSRNPSHLFDSSRPDGHQTIADKQYYLNYLKNKYALPKPTGTDLVSELKERNFLIERVYELLIDDFASTLEQLSKLSEKS